MTRYTYTPEKLPLPESVDELRARIPGWGVDADPADRPSYPRELPPRDRTGGDGDFPERQPEHWPRERSIEHETLPPVFGTSCPPRGVPGAIRRVAYRRYSEARAAHWLLLMVADRVESRQAVLRSFLSTRPDNPFTETGVRAELTRGGVRSRLGRGRADVVHHPVDPVIVGGSWALGAVLGWRVVRSVARRT